MLGQDREGSRDHQVGSCEQGNIVKPLHQSQARGERLEDERRRILVCMSPLEAKKLFFRVAAKEQRVWRRGRWKRRKLMFIDVKKAHLNGKVPDDEYAFVKLPDGKI